MCGNPFGGAPKVSTPAPPAEEPPKKPEVELTPATDSQKKTKMAGTKSLQIPLAGGGAGGTSGLGIPT